MRERGFHDAVVSHDDVLHRGLIVLRVRLYFGKRFETRYEGNDHYDKWTLDSVLVLMTPGLGSVMPAWMKKPWARRFGWSLWASGHRR